MLCDEFPELGVATPKPETGTAVTIHLHVDNADEVAAAPVSRERPARDGRCVRMPAHEEVS